MNSKDHYYIKAMYRPGVECVVGEQRAVFTYDQISFDVDCNDEAAEEIFKFNKSLRTGLEMREIEREFDSFSPYIWQLIEVLDRYGFLIEGAERNYETLISGAAFWKEIEAFSQRAKQKYAPVMYQALADGRVNANILIRYVKEYYHMVKAGPQIIAGALPHTSDPVTRKMLEAFLVSEVGHEEMLLQSLSAIDESAEALPLCETFALISALQVMADQEPLSFKAAVFLLEEANPDFHEAFVAASKKAGMPAGFWEPVVQHAHINDDGDHESISQKLLSQIELVTMEERIVVLKQVSNLIESLVAFEKAILAAG